ncbi:MAG: hypothetical protein PVG51_07060 [Desulfosarcina sp.]|jgi:hypothetical protein
MIRLLLIIGLMLLMTGCATHYYDVKGDTLNLYLNHPDAKKVTFACSLDGFEPHDARKVDGRWMVSVPSQKPFRYYYMLNGELFLPPCKLKENDDFGSKNCIFTPHL